MFRNLINITDLLRLVEKIRQGEILHRFMPILQTSKSRIKESWRHTQNPPKHWTSIPAVRRRWNRLVTGNPSRDIRTYIAEKYLTGRKAGALSVACGAGGVELEWAKTGVIRCLDAFDISEERIRFAAKQAAESGLDHVVKFFVADAETYTYGANKYDVVIAESALHHLRDLRRVIGDLAVSLRPGGLMVVNDFVGPSRFQWTDRQLEVVNGLLRILPVRYRTRWKSGSVKNKFYRSGRLSMWLSDPSEAAESDKIMDALSLYFEPLEVIPLGGTVLQLLFADIAHHFLSDTGETQKLLEMCFAVEDVLIDSGELPSDFVFGVFKKR